MSDCVARCGFSMMMQLKLLIAVSLIAYSVANECHPISGSPANEPIGVGKGIHPGRVAWVREPDCCSWDGKSEYYYSQQYIDEDVVDWMFIESLLKLTGETTDVVAWQKLFEHYNLKHHGVARNYTSGEKIAVKINLNTCYPDYSCNLGNGISPQYLKSFLRSLTRAGVPQDAIYMYDGSRMFTDCLWNPPVGIHGEFPSIHVVDNQGLNGREKIEPDFNSNIVFSCKDIAKYNETRLPTILTAAQYVIEINALRGHVLGGITASGKNWFGSIYRPVPEEMCEELHTYWCPATLHNFVDAINRPMGSYNVLVDLLGHPQMGGAVMVAFTDGLYSGIDMGKDTPPTKWLSMQGTWSSSVFASQDLIAMDSVLFDVLHSEPTQINAQPSFGIAYNPTGEAPLTESLGVHEHWNHDHLYSRNLGTGEGIELVYVSPKKHNSVPLYDV